VARRNAETEGVSIAAARTETPSVTSGDSSPSSRFALGEHLGNRWAKHRLMNVSAFDLRFIVQRSIVRGTFAYWARRARA